jgi:Holliday junction resolvasome RuvABC endonuclease subunit
MILAMDIGSQLGVVYGDKEKIHSTDFINLLEKGVFNHKSFSKFYNVLYSYIDKGFHDNLKIILEKPFALSTFFNAQRVLFGMYGVIQTIFRDEDIFSIAPNSLKKFWCGNGHATKDQMIIETRNRGLGEQNEHLSDALALYNYWKEIYSTI